jgi:predicted homoserine dehydrogenase-like protein
MIIIDEALKKLKKEGKSIKVGMVGAGFMGRGVAIQFCKYATAMDLVAISNRNIERARNVYQQADAENITEVDTVSKLENAIREKKPAITDNPDVLCESESIDVIIEVTGAVEFSAHVVLKAIENKKHVIINAELDGTVGPLLKDHADRHGVVLSSMDGDQPGVEMNLFRFVRSIGAKPVLCGNIKGLHDPYRTPTTQEGFAKKWGQNPSMVTSFADGSKISFEQAIVANATRMKVGKRGMYGPTVNSGTHLKEVIHDLYPMEKLSEGAGIVDYVVGAEPGPGIFILATHDHPIQKHYLNLYKLGEGPLYLFYTPYHLCHFEIPFTVARAKLFGDAALTPAGPPTVEVVAAAKRDIKKGEKLDDIGHYMTYGLCENTGTARKENLLPIGLAKNCTALRDIPKDHHLSFDDVSIPEDTLIHRLWNEQFELFSGKQTRPVIS